MILPRRLAVLLLSASALFASAAWAQTSDPRLTSWVTNRSAQYARVYETSSDKTSGNAVSTWPRSGLTNGGGGQATSAYSDVQRVAYSTNYVYITTTGLPSYTMGHWLTPTGGVYTSWPTNRAAIHRIPRNPSYPTTKQKTNGSGGVLVNGVFVWANGDAQSYSTTTSTVSMAGQGVWNRLAGVAEAFNFDSAYGHQPSSGAYHNHVNPIALRYQLGDNVTYNSSTKTYSEATTLTRHSPLIGWANDGLPIYGPYGYSSALDATSGIRRMTTGFQKRDGTNGTINLASTGRVTLPVWSASVQGKSANLSSSDFGPAVNGTYTLGIFAEDYEYLGDIGKTQGVDFDLNRQNVRYCVTPEFPSGTYAYFVAIDASGATVFPDVINQEFFGAAAMGPGTVTSITETVLEYAIGGPAATITATAATSGANVLISWNSAEGATYKVESSPDQTTWTTLSSTVTSAGIATSYTTATAAAFYRVTLTALSTYDTNGTTGTPLGKTAIASYSAAAIAPTISTHPSGATINTGGAATLSVVASGTPTLSYQWYKDTVEVSGATSASFAVVAAQTSDAGSYACVVTNAAGSATSNSAALVVNIVPVAPTITTHPTGASVVVGGSASFTVSASGTAPLAYQWQKDTVAIGGATQATLTLTSVVLGDAGSYVCAVTNTAGNATSNAAVLSVSTGVVAATIASQPSSASVAIGGSVTFTVGAGGTAPFTYQWQKGTTDIAGATSASYTIASVATTDAGNFRCIVTNVGGSATSAAATLTVTTPTAPPTITQQPANQSVVAGQVAIFTVAATGTAPLTYQWIRNGAGLAGATTATLTLTNAQTANAGAYAVTVTNAYGVVTSSSATLTVAASATAPTIVTGPVSQTVATGAGVSFVVVAGGTAPLSYQWYRNGAPLSGATSAMLAIFSATATDVGSYSVTVTNSAGTATSGVATLIVTPPASVPTITSEPVDANIGIGGALTLAVAASGGGTLSYQWRRNGSALPGQTQASLTIGSATSNDAGVYSVLVSNAVGTVTSRSAQVRVSGRAVAGVYFGSFSGGTLALYVRTDRSGAFFAYGSGGIAVAARSVIVDDDGRFRFTSLQTSAATEGRAAAASEVAVDGTIGNGGALAGNFVSGSLALAFSGTQASSTGGTAAVAGLYEGGATGSSVAIYTVIGGDGRAFVMTQSSTGSDAGSGNVDTTGRLTVTTVNGASVTGTVNGAIGIVSATVSSSGAAPLVVAAGAETRVSAEKLANLSTRGSASTTPLIVGFVVGGDTPKPMLVRAVGPTLRTFGVAAALPAARLELYRGATVIATAGDWGATNRAAIASTAARVGAFALAADSRDSALLVTLEPGTYSAIVSPVQGATGVALVEVYDAAENAGRSQRLLNLATRAGAGAGDSTLIAGFVITGELPKRVLVRAVGPGLSAFGVSGVLQDPLLRVTGAGDALVASNDNWSEPAASAVTIAAAASQVGAFALTGGSKDAALLVYLAPGAYSAQVTGVGGSVGTALVEVYEVP